MENSRFLLYILVLVLVFLILGMIKSFLPHPEPKKQIDQIGIALFKPVLYGSSSKNLSEASEQIKEQELVFSDIEENSYPSEYDEENVIEESDESVVDESSMTAKGDLEVSNAVYFDQMLVDYKNEVQSKRKYRNDVVVRYYKHAPDRDKASVLVDYGFYLHVRPVKDSGRYESTRSNVIYYGEDFPKSDLKLIAYLLVSNGIEIKQIRRFKDFDGWKRNAIEIGGDSKLSNAKPLTLETIRNLE